MKRIQDIEKLTAADWDRIGADESIPVPEDLQVRLPRRRTAARWSIAAVAAVLIGLGWAGFNQLAAPKDTYEDPYLAYAAVEQAFSKMSGNVQKAAGQVAHAEEIMDKYNYWK